MANERIGGGGDGGESGCGGGDVGVDEVGDAVVWIEGSSGIRVLAWEGGVIRPIIIGEDNREEVVDLGTL